MHDPTELSLAIFSAMILWTTSVIGGMIWLNGKFRGIEAALYREMNKLRHEFEARHYSLNTRVIRLEMKRFGYSGGNGGPVTPDDGETFP